MIILEKKDGSIINKQGFDNNVKLLKDGKYKLVKYYRKRTNPQNAYYWKLLEIVEEETGNDKDYLHQFLKMEFLIDKTRKRPYVKSTTSLTTIEFVDYIEKVKNFMANEGIRLPDPEFLEIENY